MTGHRSLTEPNWQRIDPDKHAWLRERNEMEPDLADLVEFKRYYVPESRGRRQWPLLVVSVIPRWESKPTGRHRVSVSGSIKRGRDEWFEESYGIPTALLDDVAEMFTAFIKKAKHG